MIQRFRLSLSGFAPSWPAWSLLLLLAPTGPPVLAQGRPAVADTGLVNRLNLQAVRTAEQKNLPLGRQLAAEARVQAQRMGYLRGELNSIQIMATLAIEGGNFVAALRGYNQGIELAKAKKQTSYYEPFYASLGACALEMEQYAYAVDMLRTSQRYGRRYPSRRADTAYVAARTNAHLAKAYLGLGRFPEAMEACRLTFRAGSDAPSYPDVEVIMAELMRRTIGSRSSSESALELLQKAQAQYHRVGERHKESQTLLTMSRLLADEGRPDESGAAAQQAAAYAKPLRAVPIQMKALEYQAQAAVAQGNYREAYELLAEASRKKDELFNQEKASELEKQQAKFLIENEKQRFAALAKVNEANRNLAKARQGKLETLYYWLVSAGLFIVVGSFLYGRLRRGRAQLARVYEKLHTSNEQLEGALVDIRQKVEEKEVLVQKISQKVQEKEVLVQEKEVLIQEIHHRVKNNLQLVSSLLGWQSSVYPEPALVEALGVSQARIQSMGLVHEQLYSADNLAEVGLDSYITKLLDSLLLSFKSDKCPVTITTDLAPLVMTAQQAIPFGLLVNELITNAYKHAFVGRTSGEMRVELRPGPKGTGFEFRMSDNGVGMPPPGTERPTSLGTQLIKSMAGQLKAEYIVESDATGTRVVLRRNNDLAPINS